MVGWSPVHGALARLSLPWFVLLAVGPVSAQRVWAEKTTGPPGRPTWEAEFSLPTQYAMAYDSSRHKTVLYADETTWEWDSVSWTRRFPATLPGPMGGHVLVYDSARDRTLLFNGGPSHWEWDGIDWTQRTPATYHSGVYGRQYQAMAYDPARRRVVMFGGFVGGPFPTSLNDTWEWDGNDWVQRTPLLSPPNRGGAAMAYDAARGRIVLYGGSMVCCSIPPDVWEWDGQDWTRHPTASNPPTTEATMAYDPARGRVLLFAGYSSLGDVWEWDGIDWTKLVAPGGPGPRSQHALAFDTTRRHAVLFGGNDPQSGAPFSDTWEWDGSAWIGPVAPSQPSDRSKAAMVYDAARHSVVLFGGFQRVLERIDTWTWDGVGWSELRPSSQPPFRGSMAYDSARQLTVLFGRYYIGYTGGTWEWNGIDWTPRSTDHQPSSREDHTMAYDAARRRVVLFGGIASTGRPPPTYRDTWEFDGIDWIQRSPASSPPAMSDHEMAFDAARGVTVLFGGQDATTSLAETWEWDGDDWSQRSPGAAPTARYGHGMAYDSARARVVLWGGQTPLGYDRSLWEWDGTSWTEVPAPAIAPAGAPSPALVYDSARSRLVAFGGMPSPRPFAEGSETWEYGSLVPSSATSLGQPCAAGGYEPTLIAFGKPALGNASFALEVHRAEPLAPCAFGLSAGQATSPIGGCVLHLQAPIVAVAGTVDAFGRASLPLPVPAVPALYGVDLYGQAFGIRPASAPPGLWLSNASNLTLGE